MPSLLTRLSSWQDRARSRLLSFDVAGALCLIIVGIAAISLVRAVMHRPFDYDELEHAYSAWLIRRGEKPFYDFFECHPPFLWYPLSLLFRIFDDSYDLLFVFRFIALLGQVAFMIGVVKNAALSLRQLPTPVVLPARVGALAIAVIAFHPAIFDYLLEFRIDSWPNALLVIAIYRYRSRREDAFRASAELAALSMAAVLCSPKLILFAALFAAISLVVDDRRLSRVGGMAAGGAGMLALGAGLLRIAGLNPIHVYRLSLFYHQVLNTKGGFGHGLADAVWGHAVARKILIASVIAWPIVAWQRIHRAAFELAVLAFLALQLKLVSFPYKQYYSPWYLLSVAFLPYLMVLFRRIRPLHSLVLAVAILYAGSNVLEVHGNYASDHDVVVDIRARKELETLVPAGGYIVGTIPGMPLFKRSAFYQLINSWAPSGFDGARIMQDLNVPPFSKEFTVEAARAEIEARRPSLIMMGAAYPPFERQALEAYVAAHEAWYTRQQGHFGLMLVRKR